MQANPASGTATILSAGHGSLAARLPNAALAIMDGTGAVRVLDPTDAAAVKRAITDATAAPPDRILRRGQRVRLVGYAYYDIYSCQILDHGSFTLTTPPLPLYGTVDYGSLNFTLGSGSCAGTTLPFDNAYYTWNANSTAPGGTYDSLDLRFTVASAGIVADTHWSIQLSVNADADVGKGAGSGGDGGYPSCRSPAPVVPVMQSFPKTPSVDCTWGNPLMAVTGNKFQVERDLEAAPHTGIAFTRYYNSLFTGTTPLGNGWRSQWHRGLDPSSTPGTVYFTREDGRRYTFLTTVSSGRIVVTPRDTDITSRLTATYSSGGTQTGWTLVRDDDAVERYSPDGRLLDITARNGQVTTLAYNASNQLTSVTGPFGHTLQFQYSGTRLSRVTGPDGGAYTFGYDAVGNLTSAARPDGTTRGYVYENAVYGSFLTGIIDELGTRFATYTYDTSGHVISSVHALAAGATSAAYNADGSTTVTDSRGNPIVAFPVIVQNGGKPQTNSGAPLQQALGSAFSYDSNGYLASLTDWNGNVTNFTHDARGNETSRTEAVGSRVARSFATSWLPNFNLPSRIDAPTETITFTYDGNGNALTRTEVAGGLSRTWTFTYSPVGQLLTSQDPNGNTTTMEYDARGNVASVTNALGQTTTIPAYDANGRPTRIVDPNGLVTTMTYDPRGRLTSRNVGGELTSFGYDAVGNQVSTTRPDGSRLVMTYDAAHRLTAVTDSLGNKVAYTLDSEGNPTTVAAFTPGGNLSRTVSYTYDSSNRLSQTIGALGQTTSMTRDLNGNILRLVDPLGYATAATYDALNRKTASTDPNGGVTRTTFDAMNRVTSVTDPRGLTTSYSYTGFGDLLQLTSPDSGVATRTFDNAGNLTTSTDARGLTNTRTYDPLNRLTSIAYLGGSFTYQYDAGSFGIGRLTQVAGTSDTTSFTYDQRGHLLTKQQTVGRTSLTQRYAYNAAGQLTSTTYPSGMLVAYGYNAAGQTASLSVNGSAFMTAITHEPFGPAKGWSWFGQTVQRPHDTDGRLVSLPLGTANRILSYDAASQITGYNDSPGTAQSFAYDPLGRLSQYTSPTVGQTYGYDADGNRTSLSGTAGATSYAISTTSNELLSHTNPGTSYIYDASGNLTATGALSFSYDGLGRMTGSLPGSARAARTVYTTSGLGERVQKSGPSATTNFLYEGGGRLFGEYGAASSQETIYLEGMPVGLFTNGALLRIYADQLGAPRLIANAAGTTQWTWDGDPFGNVAPTGTLTFNQRFPGQYVDAETGLYYNMARYYDPKVGRYLNPDPIEPQPVQPINRYTYVESNPISAIDPYGLWTFQSTVWIGFEWQFTVGYNSGHFSLGSAFGAGLGNSLTFDPDDSGCTTPGTDWTLYSSYKIYTAGVIGIDVETETKLNKLGSSISVSSFIPPIDRLGGKFEDKGGQSCGCSDKQEPGITPVRKFGIGASTFFGAGVTVTY